MTPEEILDKVYQEMKSAWALPSVDPRWRKVALKAMKEFAISQLQQHIEHPTKPGYKRHDILEKIKELEK
jgi:hypothetical protein